MTTTVDIAHDLHDHNTYTSVHPLVNTLTVHSMWGVHSCHLDSQCACMPDAISCACVLRRVLEGPHFLWWDNFSKNIARYCPSLEKGVYTSCLWTGSAVFACPEHDELDHRVIRNNADEVIPAMPDNLLEHQHSVMRGLQQVFQQGRSRYAESLVYQHEVNVVPLKILSADDQKNQHGSEGHSMNVVFPERIMPQNIGSNLGLISLLKAEVHDKYGMGTNECQHYVNLNVDENIFYRILKVIACVESAALPICCHMLCNNADVGDVQHV